MSSNITWKDKSFNQILTTIRKNKNDSILTPRNMHNAPPLKLYRKEINPSTSLIVQISGQNIIPSSGSADAKIIHRINYCTIDKNGVCFSPQQDAKKRIRTSGIIKNNYNMDTKQYMQRRNITFEQNQYNFLQSGNSAVKPGSAGSLLNMYTMQSSTVTDCVPKQVVYKPNNSQFAQNGAVSSSSLLARKKYNTITSNANEYSLPYGVAVANAMSYGVSESAHTYKSKLAFPVKMTPKSNKYSNTMTFCENVKMLR
jgi:hypothetical protein